MIRQEMRSLTWRPFESNGRPGDPVTFEIPAGDYEVMRALEQAIEELPPGPARTVKITELRTLLDLWALLGEGTVSVEVEKTAEDLEVEAAAASGFVIPAQFRAQMPVGQLVIENGGDKEAEPARKEEVVAPF